MPVIKRYPNRKLYDTSAKQYITLDGIAELIRDGEEVHVIDNATGEDLTAVTLSQIIFEQEKKQSGFLPRSVLAGLIQAGGDRINALGRTLGSTFGFHKQVDEEIKRRMQALVQLGEVTVKQADDMINKLLSPEVQAEEEAEEAQRAESISTQDLELYLAKKQVPTRADLQPLLQQLEELATQLEELNQKTES